MADAQTAVVHNFKMWNNVKGDYDFSPFKATAEAIERLAGNGELKCVIQPGTAETVDASLLDERGVYKPA